MGDSLNESVVPGLGSASPQYPTSRGLAGPTNSFKISLGVSWNGKYCTNKIPVKGYP